MNTVPCLKIVITERVVLPVGKIDELLKKDFIFLDGAMGTMLQASGLKLGERPEVLCITEPETIIRYS